MELELNSFQREILSRTGVAMPTGSAIELSLGPSAHVNRPLSNIAVQYQNRELVADTVMPWIKVPNKSDNYFQFLPETMFSVAKTEIAGNEGVPSRVSYGLDALGTYSCVSRGLMDFVSVEDQQNADSPLDPQITAVEVTTNFLMLAREIRVAAKVFGSGNYGSNTQALSGSDRWDQSTSDPVTAILTALRAPLVRPDTMVIGEQAWDALRVHPKVIQFVLSRAMTKSGATPLMVDEAAVAAMFRLRQVIVGTAIYNTAAEGQTASYSRVWGKSCALIKVEPNPDKRRTQTFGYTFRFMPFETRSIFSEMPGVAGGTYLKVTHSDDEKIVGGANVGYLFTTVVS